MSCPRCGTPVEKEKPDSKTKIYASTGTKIPYCHFCDFEQWIKQDPMGVGVVGEKRSNNNHGKSSSR